MQNLQAASNHATTLLGLVFTVAVAEKHSR